MGTVELRNKWKEAIGKVDDRFFAYGGCFI